MFENGGRGIGDKGKDNGLLLLVAVDDRKVKFEIGYDLEGIIPDGYAGETIREAIAPAFRAAPTARGCWPRPPGSSTASASSAASPSPMCRSSAPAGRSRSAQPISRGS